MQESTNSNPVVSSSSMSFCPSAVKEGKKRWATQTGQRQREKDGCRCSHAQLAAHGKKHTSSCEMWHICVECWTAEIYPGNCRSTKSSPWSRAHVANGRWTSAVQMSAMRSRFMQQQQPLADQDGLNVQPTLSVPTELLIRRAANERSKDTVNDAINKKQWPNTAGEHCRWQEHR